MPESLATAYRISNEENPDLQISLLEYKQAKFDVGIAKSDLLPSATLKYKIAEQEDIRQIIYESADLIYHLLVMWKKFDLTPDDIYSELESREGKTGIRQ